MSRATSLVLRLAVAGLLAGLASGQAAPANQIEYQVKAAYLYNFAKFVEWPPPPLQPGASFRIGVLADPDAFAIIAETLQGRKISDHPIEVVLLTTAADISGCRVVFVPRSSEITPARFHASQPAASVLLVGEQAGFAAAGGDIGFIPRGDNLRYQVNLAAAQRAGLRLSGRLANLAELVHSPAP